MKRLGFAFALPAAALALVAASPVMAEGNGSTRQHSIGDIVQSREAKGYTRIDEIDRDLDRYDVEANAPDGRRVELTLDAASGNILRNQRDRD